eukprot:192478-Rhodomonas_salina.3
MVEEVAGDLLIGVARDQRARVDECVIRRIGFCDLLQHRLDRPVVLQRLVGGDIGIKDLLERCVSMPESPTQQPAIFKIVLSSASAHRLQFRNHTVPAPWAASLPMRAPASVRTHKAWTSCLTDSMPYLTASQKTRFCGQRACRHRRLGRTPRS